MSDPPAPLVSLIAHHYTTEDKQHAKKTLTIEKRKGKQMKTSERAW